jgi:hypothetical protein
MAIPTATLKSREPKNDPVWGGTTCAASALLAMTVSFEINLKPVEPQRRKEREEKPLLP